MRAHTPRPWTVEPSDRGAFLILHKEAGVAIAKTFEPGQQLNRLVGAVDPKANAVLLGICPDMLEVLSRLTLAAEQREYTMGDPCGLLVVKAELREAAAEARALMNALAKDST